MKAPQFLLKFQDQFIQFIKQPSVKRDLEKECVATWIKPCKNLSAYERLEIYRELYWEKETKLLKVHFPIVARFLGDEGFREKIAAAFLSKFPFTGLFTENVLVSLPQWVEQEYRGEDRDRVLLFVQADAILGHCSIAKKLKPFDISLESSPFSVPLTLQPHVYFAYFHCNVLSMIQEASKNESSPLPPLRQIPTHSIVFRDRLGFIHCETVDEKLFSFLRSFEKALSLKEALALLEKTHPSKDYLQPYAWFDFWSQQEIFVCGERRESPLR